MRLISLVIPSDTSLLLPRYFLSFLALTSPLSRLPKSKLKFWKDVPWPEKSRGFFSSLLGSDQRRAVRELCTLTHSSSSFSSSSSLSLLVPMGFCLRRCLDSRSLSVCNHPSYAVAGKSSRRVVSHKSCLGGPTAAAAPNVQVPDRCVIGAMMISSSA